jgi:2-dehydropantoate 2-reductase
MNTIAAKNYRIMSGMEISSFYVVGAGGIGLLLQYLLQKNNDCRLVTTQRSFERLSDAPLKVSGSREDMVDVPCLRWTDVTRLDPNACVLLTVKSHQVLSVLDTLKPLLAETNIVALCQNGIGIYDLARQALPKNPILRLSCWMGVRRVDLNHIDVAGVYKFDLGGEPRNEACLRAVGEILSATGIPLTVSTDPRKSEWQKALWNIAVNGLCSLLNGPNGIILDNPEVLDCAKLLVTEAVEVAALDGIHLSEEDQLAVFASLEKTRANINATLQDLRAGRHPELEFLNGAVVETATRHDQKAPVNETIMNLVTYIEKTKAAMPAS